MCYCLSWRYCCHDSVAMFVSASFFRLLSCFCLCLVCMRVCGLLWLRTWAVETGTSLFCYKFNSYPLPFFCGFGVCACCCTCDTRPCVSFISCVLSSSFLTRLQLYLFCPRLFSRVGGCVCWSGVCFVFLRWYDTAWLRCTAVPYSWVLLII